ncbi:MAG: D-alanyl-D-alanine carboxypeptidase [Lachnospiraceae bacterium]|nr:D-alanyl-D-alanine carboxypeptidase [Lachnospiraceae bacterium]
MRKFYHKLWISICLILSMGLWYICPTVVQAMPALTEEEDRVAIPIETNSIENWPEGPVVTSQSAILMDAETGVILYAKNIHEQLYPASTTKLLTCLIATEQCSMDEIVTFSHDAIFDTPRDSSHIALDEGNQLTLEQCLNAILIASANEVSFGVAEHVTGTSWEDFAPLMNERATELGCVDSNFVNPNGLPDENHYTSAYDLAMIGRAFFANELLCKMASSPRLELPPTENQPKHIIANSKNQLFPGKTYAYEYLVGSKTGYTNAAMSTLVSCAEKDGLKLIAVVMATDSPNQFADTVSLFNYGFNNFEKVNISQTETQYNIDHTGVFYSNNDIFGSSDPILALDTKDCIILPKTVPFSDLTSSISYDSIETGEAALITYSYKGQFLGSVSVNFASNMNNRYSFEDSALQSASDNMQSPAPKEQKVIFINVFKVLLVILLIAGACILVVVLYSFFTNYHFSPKEKSGRKSWLKERRRKRNRYQLNRARRMDALQSSSPKRRKRRKRPNRFRDFDF